PAAGIASAPLNRKPLGPNDGGQLIKVVPREGFAIGESDVEWTDVGAASSVVRGQSPRIEEWRTAGGRVDRERPRNGNLADGIGRKGAGVCAAFRPRHRLGAIRPGDVNRRTGVE